MEVAVIMDNLENRIRNNHLNDPDDIDALLETADLVRQLIRDDNYVGVNKVISYTIENSLYEAFSWVMALLQEEFEKDDDYCLDSFTCSLGKSIPDYDELTKRLQVEFDVQKNDVESVYDEHGEVESFFNTFTYKTKYKNIFFISSENFDTKDNDYIQYKLLFSR